MKPSGRARGPGGRAAGAPRSGLAILSVLLVLLALLVLTAPFLMTARNASSSSTQLAERVQARLALDAAERHARAALGRSHIGVDVTPYFDDEQELAVTVELERDFLNARDTGGVMWDVTAADVAGRIDVNSASPHVFANLLGATTRLVEQLAEGADAIPVSSTLGFEPQGFLWIGRELVAYTEREPQAFKGLTRGLLGGLDAEGKPLDCGPAMPMEHPAGTPVLDQRAFAPVEWRNRVADGDPRQFDAPEQVRDAGRLALAGLADGALAPIDQLGSVFAGVRAGRQWQRAARLADSVRGGRDCVLVLDQAHWFAPGTTVQISDGTTSELGLVLAMGGTGVVLMEPVTNDYHAYTAEVRPLARRPVNVNVASAETLEVLLANLQLQGVNERITRTEARELALRMLVSRPFTGLEDLLTRVLLPAAGIEAAPAGEAVIIDPYDALAAYENALNANSSSLAYATMPFCFTSRDVYELDLRAAVNAPSGVERVSSRRNVVELIAPQQELLQLFARQEDFDEALRLDREAPWWSTGPAATSRWDLGAVPPSRFGAHIGTFRGALFVPGISQAPEDWVEEGAPVPERVFASREDDGWAQLWPARVAALGPLAGKMMHFDHETRDPEGRFLPDENLTLPTEDERLGWTDPAFPLMRCMSLSMWIKPRELRPGILFDVGQSSLEADRITLAFDEQDLVLRVLDAMGDHGGTPDFREGGEARYALTPGVGPGAAPGLLPDVWTHVAVDVRGNRPDQVTLRVDGRALGVRQAGLSRLAAGVTGTSTMLELEDGTGFPERGVVRIGREWIEYRKAAPNALDCSFSVDDALAPYAGGRFARLPFQEGAASPSFLVETGSGSYAAGTPVELAGYTKLLESQVSAALGGLPETVGLFRVAYVERVIGGQTNAGDRIVREPGSINFGRGLDAVSNASALELMSADAPGTPLPAGALLAGGGYAALVQLSVGTFLTAGVQYPEPHSTSSGPIGGIEIIRYSSFDGTTLQIAERGVAAFGSSRRAFVSRWQQVFVDGSQDSLQSRVFVVPISIPVGAQAAQFPSSHPNRSEFAQITRRGADLDQTEWVRYDTMAKGHLVRHADAALNVLHQVLTRGSIPVIVDPLPPGPASAPAAPAVAAPKSSPAPAGAAAPARPPQTAALWDPYLGSEDPSDVTAPVSRAARAAFQFRGVFGTYQHEHPPGTPVLPSFRVDAGSGVVPSFDAGLPGRKDAVLLVDGDPQDLGWPGVIHHTWRPLDYTVYGWHEPSPDQPVADGEAAVPEDFRFQNEIHVAFEEPFAVPIPPLDPSSTALELETRLLPRMLKFPSGERPRIVERAVVGGDIRGAPAPGVVIDELAFGTPAFGFSLDVGDVTLGAPLVLLEALPEGDSSFQVFPHALLMPAGLHTDKTNFLGDLPDDAGLLRLGSEVVCYSDYDEGTGAITIAQGGRGLLGTVEENHVLGARATFLEDAVVTTLSAAVSAGGSALPITDPDGFPREGTVLVGDELIHYTRIAGGALEMPRASREPGAMDRKGDGLFRGRYGTNAAAHQAGEPVILFPFRYWDRQAERADAPELSYFGFAVDQPGAFWRSVFWEAEQVEGSQVYVLQRAVDPDRGEPPPWDADPEGEARLALFETGLPRGEGNPIGLQADRLEWRAFVRYLPGAFDAVDGLSHDWKRTPRLRLFGVEYLGPNQVLRRFDQ